ncbi:putative ribosomal protein L28 [Zopfochytrium polystomum]|nr:putative ribosomal protein L28 [Zopfochytrium polystomum]
MSAEIAWSIIRNNSCHLVKRNGITLNRDPKNLRNKNSFKYSHVNKKTITVASAGKGLSVATKTKVAEKKPSKGYATSIITKGGNRRILKSVRNLAINSRPDLKNDALARASRLLEIQQAKPAKVNKHRAKRLQK